MSFDISPGAKVIVPVVLAKSSKLAGDTLQLTLFVPVVSPVRVTVKVKGLLPKFPSVRVTLLGEMLRLTDCSTGVLCPFKVIIL